ncbi:MAG TPA: hypothetical protein VGE45_02390 [Chloroflexia bacterium]|jgi:hypothetical protein
MEESLKAHQEDWQQVRRIIREWLTVHARTDRSLAIEARITPSSISRFLNGITATLEINTAAKLFSVIREDIKPLDRYTFLRVTGLLDVLIPLQRVPVLEVDIALNRSLSDPYKLGIYLMNKGIEVAQSSWEEAVPFVRGAEATFGPRTNEAARAACMLALLLVCLCDYDSALQEVARIERDFDPVMDYGTKADLYMVKGWLNYYLGDFPVAEYSFLQRIKLAEETGVEIMGDSIRHFLGRVYSEWAQSLRFTDPTVAQEYISKAKVQLDRSATVNLRLGDEVSRGYDLLRWAQSLRAQGRGIEAKALHKNVRELFGKDPAVWHLILEELRMDIQEGEDTHPIIIGAEGALHAWSEHKYPKGMSDSIHLIAEAKAAEGNVEEALADYVTSLCLYPFENHLRNRYLWGAIRAIRSDIRVRRGSRTYEDLVKKIEEAIEERTGYFLNLDNVVADRKADIERILKRLGARREGTYDTR